MVPDQTLIAESGKRLPGKPLLDTIVRCNILQTFMLSGQEVDSTCPHHAVASKPHLPVSSDSTPPLCFAACLQFVRCKHNNPWMHTLGMAMSIAMVEPFRRCAPCETTRWMAAVVSNVTKPNPRCSDLLSFACDAGSMQVCVSERQFCSCLHHSFPQSCSLD